MQRPWAGLFLIPLLAAAQDQPVIRVGTRLVEVDVVVRGKNGPVTDLTKDDFTLLDQGKPQRIAVFSLAAHKSQDQPEPLLPGAVSNRLDSSGEVPANATILLFDALNTTWVDENYAHQQVMKFIRSLGDKDQLALYALGKELRVVQDFTNDRARLLAGAAGLKALVDPVIHEDPSERARSRAEAKMQQEERRSAMLDHTRITQTALEEIARHLAGLPGRKNLVWLADSFIPNPDPDLLRKLEDANIAIYLVDAHGEQALGPTAENKRAQPTGGRRGRGAANDATQAEETIAQSTGGLALYHTNDLSGSIRKAIDDASDTYILGFYPAQKSLDATFHKLTVKVARKGLDVRHRQDYFAFEEQAPTDQDLRETLNRLIGDSLDATAIGLTAVALPDRELVLNVNLGDVHLDQREDRWTGAIEIAFHFEKENKMSLQTVNLSLTRDQLLAALKSGLALTKIIPGGGTGDLRVVVQDRATGAAGSVGVRVGSR
jgi:VWFA-related protein